MADIAILSSQVASAPQDYTVPGAQEILLKAVGCTVNGTNASGSFLPALQMLDPSGHVMWTAVNSALPVAAGGSALVSWFPGGGVNNGDGSTASSEPTGPASGDLAAQYPNPTVVAIEETGGPTRLALGSIPDGDFLQRSGASVVGVASSASISVTDGTTTVNPASTIDFTSGATVSSGGAGIADVSITAGGGFVGARIWNSSNQSIPDSLDTALSFDTVIFDTGSFANLGAHPTRLTIPSNGYYECGGCTAIAGNATTFQGQIVIHLNGVGADELVSNAWAAPGVTGNAIGSIGTVYSFTAGDYIELINYQNSGSAKNSLTEAFLCPIFWIVKVG